MLPILLSLLMLVLAACSGRKSQNLDAQLVSENDGESQSGEESQEAAEPDDQGRPESTGEGELAGESQPESTGEEAEELQIPGDAEDVRLHFFSVDGVDNWGDCTYIEFPNGENMLIDTGLQMATRQIVEELLDEGIDHIDHLVLTHSHADHVQGLSNILGNMTVKKAYTSGYFTTDFQWVLRDLKGRGVEHIVLHAGDSFSIGDVQFDVLWPRAEDVAVSPDNDSTVDSGPGSTPDLNNHSIVFKMTYGENTAMFTGDLYAAGEADLLKNYEGNLEVLKCDLLKVMHHGIETSSTEAFVQALSPKYAVAMQTRTMTGEVYKRYQSVGCTMYLSWMNGDVYAAMDGKNVTVTAENMETADYYTGGAESPENSD